MQTLEQVRASIKRWRSRAKRAQTALDKLYRLEARMLRIPASPAALPPVVVATPADALLAHVEDQLGIPSFLQRGLARKSPLSPAAVNVLEENEVVRKRKSAGRIAKMKAGQSGETKRMPLSGKAALAAINQV